MSTGTITENFEDFFLMSNEKIFNIEKVECKNEFGTSATSVNYIIFN